MRKVYITRLYIVIEIVSYVLLAVSFIIAVVGMITLEGEFPAHYDWAGNVDRYGSPAVLFVMPGIMLFANLVISLLAHFLPAECWNMPFRVKESRKPVVYRDMTFMLMLMELETAVFALVFTAMNYMRWTGGILALTILLVAAFTVTIAGSIIVAAKHNK